MIIKNAIQKSTITLLFSLLVGFTSGQGLNCELGFNEDYHQQAKGIAVQGDCSYFIKFQRHTGSFFSSSQLLQIDTTGHIEWQVDIAPLFAERIEVTDIKTFNENIVIIGKIQESCDILGDGCSVFIAMYDHFGNSVWSQLFSQTHCREKLSNLSFNQDTAIIALNENDTTRIFQIKIGTNHIDNIQIEPNNIRGLHLNKNGTYTVYSDSTIYLLDHLGSSQRDMHFSTDIKAVSKKNDSLIVVTEDSLLLLSPDLLILLARPLKTNTYAKLKNASGNIKVLLTTQDTLVLYTYSEELIPLDSLKFDYQPLEFTNWIDFNGTHLSIAQNFDLTMDQAIRYLDYSMNRDFGKKRINSDIGIIDVESTKVTYEKVVEPYVYDVEIEAQVLLKNYGEDTVQSCIVSHYVTNANCSKFYYQKEFANINLAPSDSAWLDFGLIHSSREAYPSSDTLRRNICAFSSYPDSLTDLNVRNDAFCKVVDIGVVGIEELKAEGAKVIDQSIDLTGKPVSKDTPGIVIHRYSDGTVKKVWNAGKH